MKDTKQYPTSYPSDAVKILDTMSFGNVKLVGSMSLRSQHYAHDYDGFERVDVKAATDAKAADALAKRFQKIVSATDQLPNAIILDIKCGIIEEWKVVPDSAHLKGNGVIGWDADTAKLKVKQLRASGVITAEEANEALTYCQPGIKGFLLAKDNIKFHTVRWTVEEVARNDAVLRDGRHYTLQQGILSPAVVKLDTIGFILGNQYTDFSVIYQFYNKGKVLNNFELDPLRTLVENIKALQLEGEHFKVLKRLYSLAKLRDDKATMNHLTTLLNSDLGRLYSAASNIGTLIAFLERKPPNARHLSNVLDDLRVRLGNITLPGYLKVENSVISRLEAARDTPPSRLISHLKSLEETLKGILNASTPRIASIKSASRII